MKEATWDDCTSNYSARKITPDPKRAKSLIETAHARTKLISNIDEENCNFVFEDYYTSLLEILQAIMFNKGLNVQNHICIGYYLRDIMKRDDWFRTFDDLRYKRNSLTYYGSRMEYAIAKQTIERCKELIKEISSVNDCQST